jgi:two-component system, NtrC family, sensor kinase
MTASSPDNHAYLKRKIEELTQELSQARAERGEALEQQTATSEILRVISGSPTNIQPVLDTIVLSAVRLCGGLFGGVNLFDGEMVLRPAALHNYTPAALAAVQRMYPMIVRSEGNELTERSP